MFVAANDEPKDSSHSQTEVATHVQGIAFKKIYACVVLINPCVFC